MELNKEVVTKVKDFVIARPVLSIVLFVMFAPGFIFSAFFGLLGLIGWGRIFLLVLGLSVYGAYRFAKTWLADELDEFDELEGDWA